MQERKRRHGLAHSSHAAAHAVFGLAKSGNTAIGSIACGPSSSNRGNAVKPPIANCASGVHPPMWRHRWRPIPATGGATAECFCTRGAESQMGRRTENPPSLLTSTSRTARCGPACRVVWEGESRRLLPLSRSILPGKSLIEKKSQVRQALGWGGVCPRFFEMWAFLGSSASTGF